MGRLFPVFDHLNSIPPADTLREQLAVTLTEVGLLRQQLRSERVVEEQERVSRQIAALRETKARSGRRPRR
jgi:hypothetical protein